MAPTGATEGAVQKIAIILGIVVVVLLVGYWLATGGLPKREPAAWLSARPIAHRGQWTDGPERPENSLAAFAEAARNGYAVELDAQLSADGQVVVFHDDDLERMTGVSGALGDRTLAQLQDLRLLGGKETIPTLAQVFELVDGRVPVFVEIKNPGKVGALEDKVAGEVAAYDGEATIMSFNPFSMARVAATEPAIPRGQVASALKDSGRAFYEVFLLRYLLMNWKSKPDYIAYDIQELPSTTTKIQQWRGRPLIGWVANSAQELQTAEEFCDTVEFNPKPPESGE